MQQQLVAAFRDGKLANFWFVMPIGGDQRINVEESSFALSASGLKGVAKLRTAENRERPILAGQIALDLDLKDDRLSGSFEFELPKSTCVSGKGTVSETLHRAATKTEMLAAQASWPEFAGPHGDMSAQPQPPLVEDIATGKTVLKKKFAQHGPGSNGWLGVVGDRFLFLPEGQHGTAHLGFLDRELNLFGSMWLLTNTETTAYNLQPVIYPTVDGRLIVRGGDGNYCYDLRK